MFTKIESSMQFSFSKNTVLDIESTEFYKKNSSNGVLICDFIVQRGNKILLIEAKKSSPNTNLETNKNNIEAYKSNIYNKIIHTLFVLLSTSGLRNISFNDKVPTWIANIQNPNTKIVPVLVIKNCKNEWLPILRDLLQKKLRPMRNVFDLSDIVVLNEECARKQNFII